MKVNLLIPFVIMSLICQRCALVVYPERDNIKSLQGKLDAIDGVYANVSTQRDGKAISMWAVLTKKYKDPRFSNEFDFSNSTVRLTSDGGKRILGELIVDDTTKEKLTLKGRITDDYFSVRRKVKFYGVPFVYFAWFDYKLQLGLDANNELHIDGNNGRLGWILIFAAGNKEDYNFVYKKM